MIPSRLPMPGNGARVASAQPLAAPSAPASTEIEVETDAAPETPPVVTDAATESRAVLAAPAEAQPFTPPPKPKTAGRPGAPIQFSAAAVQGMIRELEGCISPKVTFNEDMAKMRADAHKQSAEGLQRVLNSLKHPA